MISTEIFRQFFSSCFALFGCFLLQEIPGNSSDEFDKNRRPELIVQMGHSGPILCSAFSPDEKFLLTGGQDYTARLWDVATGKEIRRFLGHREPVDMVLFSPDGRRIVTHSDEGPFMLFDRDTGVELQRFDEPFHDDFLVFSPNGEWLLTFSSNGKVDAWEAETGKRRATLGEFAAVKHVEFSPNSDRVIITFANRHVVVWKTSDWQQVQSRKFWAKLRSAQFVDKGKSIGMLTEDGDILVWEVGKNEPSFALPSEKMVSPVTVLGTNPAGTHVATLETQNPNCVVIRRIDSDSVVSKLCSSARIGDVSFSPDGAFAITASDDNVARIHEVKSGNLTAELTGHSLPITAIALSKHGKRAVTCSKDTTVRLWDGRSGKQLLNLKNDEKIFHCVAISPDGTRVTTSAGVPDALERGENRLREQESGDGVVHVWDAVQGALLHKLVGHSGKVVSMAINAQGNKVVTGSADTTARIWSLETGKQLANLSGYVPVSEGGTASPDGSRVLREGLLLDPLTNRVVAKLNSPSNVLMEFASGPLGNRLVTVSGSVAEVRDGQSGELLRTLNGHGGHISSVAFSADAKRLITGSQDNTARIWDIETGRLRATLRHGASVQGVAYSSDGERVATGGWREIAIWNAKTGMLQCRMQSNSFNESMEFSSGGTHLLRTDYKDTTIWHAETGKRMHVIKNNRVVAVAPNTANIATRGWDGKTRIWDIDSGNLLATYLSTDSDFADSIAYSPSGETVFTHNGMEGTLCNAHTGRAVLHVSSHPEGIHSATFSADGKTLVTQGQGDDPSLRIWDTKTGQQLSVIQIPAEDDSRRSAFSMNSREGRFSVAAVSRDGTLVVTRDQAKFVVWNCSAQQPVAILPAQKHTVARLSPNARHIITAGGYDGGAPRVWKVATGGHVVDLEGDTKNVTCLEYAPDGRTIITGSRDGIARIWDAKTGELALTYEGHSDAVSAVAYSPDGTKVITGSEDKTAHLWEASTGKLLFALKGHTGDIKSVFFSTNGKRAVSIGGYGDEMARIWDVETGQEVAHAHTHDLESGEVAINSDGTRIVTSCWDHSARVWDLKSSRLVHTLRLGGYANAVAFSSDGKRIACGSRDENATIWNAHSGLLLKQVAPDDGVIRSVGFSPKGTLLRTMGDHHHKIWKADSGDHALSVPLSEHRSTRLHFDDNNVFVTLEKRNRESSHRDQVSMWTDGKAQEVWSPAGHLGEIKSASFSPDAQRLVTGGPDKRVCVWDARTGRLFFELEGRHSSQIGTISFSPDGIHILSTGINSDHTANIWRADTGKHVATLNGHGGAISSAIFSQDSKQVITRHEYEALLWDVRTGKLIANLASDRRIHDVQFSPNNEQIVTFESLESGGRYGSYHGNPVKVRNRIDGQSKHQLIEPIAFSPKGKIVASGGENESVEVRDSKTGKLLHRLEGHHEDPTSITFSPDGKRIATGSYDRKARIWDVASGKKLREFDGGTKVKYSNDGRYLATTRPQIWDAQTGELVHALAGHSGSIYSVAFSEDGKRVIGNGLGESRWCWDLNSGKLLSGHRQPITTVTFGANDTQVVTGSQDATIKLWSASSGELLDTYTGHLKSVSSVTVSPIQRIISTAEDKEVREWTGPSAAVVWAPTQLHRRVQVAAFSPDGQRVVTCTGTTHNTGDHVLDRIAVQWNVATGKRISALIGHTRAVTGVAFSPDGELIATKGDDGTVRVWDTRTAMERAKLPVEGMYDRGELTFSADSTLLATQGGYSHNAAVRLWHAENGDLLHTFERQDKVLGFSDDGSRLVTGKGSVVYCWDTESGTEIVRSSDHSASVIGARLLGDALQTVSGDNELESVRDWGDERQADVWRQSGLTGDIEVSALSYDGQTLVTAGEGDMVAQVWDIESSSVLFSLDGHTAGINAIAFSHDNKKIVTGAADNTVRIWNAETGKEVQKLEGHKAAVLSVAFSADDTQVASGDSGFATRGWDAKTGKSLFVLDPEGTPPLPRDDEPVSFKRHIAPILNVRCSKCHWSPAFIKFSTESFRELEGRDGVIVPGKPELSSLFTTVESGEMPPEDDEDFEEGQLVTEGELDVIRRWIQEGARFDGVDKSEPIKAGAVKSVAFSPDSHFVVTAGEYRSGSQVRVWNTSTQRTQLFLPQHTGHANDAIFGADAQRLITTDGSIARVVNAESGDTLIQLNHPESVTCVAYSPQGDRIATGSSDGIGRVWDARSRKLLTTLECRYGGDVSSIAFSPNGKQLVTGSSYGDEIARVWDAASGDLLFSLPHGERVTSIVHSGSRILTMGGFNPPRLWDATTGKRLDRFSSRYDAPDRLVAFRFAGPKALEVVWQSGAIDRLNLTSGEYEASNDFPISGDLTGTFNKSKSVVVTTKRGAATELDLATLVALPRSAKSRNPERSSDDSRLKHGKTQRLVLEQLAKIEARSKKKGVDSHAKSTDITRNWAIGRQYSISDSLLGFSQNGLLAASTRHIWNLDTGAAIANFVAPNGSVSAVAFSTDSTLLAGGQSNKVWIWNSRSGRLSKTIDVGGGTIDLLRFNNDARRIAIAQGAIVRIWDVEAGNELHHLTGHAQAVTSVVFGRNGEFVVTGSRDSSIRVWNGANGSLVRTMLGHRGAVESVEISPDASQLVTGGADGTVKLWSVESGELVRTMSGHADRVTSLKFSPNGKLLVSGADDSSVRLWDPQTSEQINNWHFSNLVEQVGWRSDSWILAFGKDAIASWTLHPNALKSQSRHPAEEARVIGLTADGNRLLTAPLGELPKELRLAPHDFRRREMRLDPRRLGYGLGVSLGRSAHLWQRFELQTPTSFAGPPVGAVNSLKFSFDGTRLFSELGPSGRGAAGLRYPHVERHVTWNLAAGTSEAVDHSQDPQPSEYRLEGIGVARLDTANGILRVTRRDGTSTNLQVSRNTIDVAGTPKTNRIAVLTNNHQLVTFDLRGGKEVQRTEVAEQITRVGFSPGGRWVITGTDPVPERLGFEDEQTWKGKAAEFISRSRSPDPLRSIILGRPDDDRFEGLGAGPAHPYVFAHSIYDADSLDHVRPFSYAGPVAFSPDEATILTVDHSLNLVGANNIYRLRILRPHPTVVLRETRTGKAIKEFRGHEDGVSAFAFSPDGKQILTGSWDNTARLWDIKSKQELTRFVGHRDYVGAVAFHPSKPWIATGSWDGTTRLWNTESEVEICEREICQLISFPDKSWAVVDPDGRYNTSEGSRLDGLHWVIDNEPVEVHQLERRYWDSDLLHKLLHDKQRLKDVASLTAPGLYPGIEISIPILEQPTLAINLTNRGGGLGPVWVKIDGRVVSEISVPNPAATREDIQIELNEGELAHHLAPGRTNIIEVVSHNHNQSTGLRSRPVRVPYTPPGEPAIEPRVWALVVGTSDYDGEDLDLDYAAKDAQDFAEALRVAVSGLWPDEPLDDRLDLRLLTSPANKARNAAHSPTAKIIRESLDEIAEDATHADIVLVYFSGHGLTLREAESSESEYVYATWQVAAKADLEDKELRRLRGILGSELRSWMKRVRARKTVLIMDTCEAGGIFGELDKARAIDSDRKRVLQRLQDRTGTYILAGSAANRFSFEASEYAQGLLTYSLLSGMQGPALESPGSYVDISRLLNHAIDRTETLADGLGVQQYPYLSVPEGSRSFPIGIIQDPQKIPVRAEKLPVFLPVVKNTNVRSKKRVIDFLNIAESLDKRFRQLSSDASPDDRQLVYLRKLLDYPNGIQLLVDYEETPEGLTTEVAVIQGKTVRQFELSAKQDAIDRLAERIISRTLKMLEEQKKPRSKP